MRRDSVWPDVCFDLSRTMSKESSPSQHARERRPTSFGLRGMRICAQYLLVLLARVRSTGYGVHLRARASSHLAVMLEGLPQCDKGFDVVGSILLTFADEERSNGPTNLVMDMCPLLVLVPVRAWMPSSASSLCDPVNLSSVRGSFPSLCFVHASVNPGMRMDPALPALRETDSPTRAGCMIGQPQTTWNRLSSPATDQGAFSISHICLP